MGNRVSSRNEVVIDVKTALSVVTNLVQNNSSKIVQTADRKNIFTLETADGSNVKITGGVNIGQTIDATNQATGNIDASIINQMNADLKNALNGAIDQASTAKSGIFNFGDTVSTVNVNKAKNAINIAVDTQITQNNYSELVQGVVDINESKVYLRGNVQIDGGVNVEQQLFSKMIARNVINAVLSNANNILAVNNTDLNIKQKADSTSGLFAGGAGTATSIISSIVSCIICILAFIVFIMVRSKKQ
jgi:hypothetical protein